jgi:hypothetical protein
MMVSDSALERIAQIRARRLQAAVREFGQWLGIDFACDQRVQDCAPTRTPCLRPTSGSEVERTRDYAVTRLGSVTVPGADRGLGGGEQIRMGVDAYELRRLAQHVEEGGDLRAA